jgi:hypothetical protein
VLDEGRAVAAGLLVGPLAGHEGRHVDLVDEGDRRERIGDLGHVVVVFFDLAEEVYGLGVQGLIGRADLVALLDAFVGPSLTRGRGRRFGVLDPFFRPLEREPGVEDAAGVQRRLGVVDHRQRRDRCQVRRLGGRGEELADPAVGDPHHPDFVVQDPGLVRDRLDDVIAVEVLQRLEEVEGAARAPRAAHVDVDHREPHQVGEERDPALRPGRVGVPVARVLDQGRRRTARQRRQLDPGKDFRHVLRRMDVDRQLGPVARGQVPVPARRDRLAVEVGAGRRGLGRQHLQRSRFRPFGSETDAIAAPRSDVAKQGPAEVVGAPRRDLDAFAVVERHLSARGQAGRIDLFHAPTGFEGWVSRGRPGGEQQREQPTPERHQ